MGPKAIPVSSEELFRARLDGQLNIRHCLIRLAKLINWHSIERQFQVHFTSERGRTVLPSRLVAGLLYLPHTNDASDEVVVATWLESCRSMTGNPYDGHTLAQTIEQVEILADHRPTTVIVDKGYQGARVVGVQILRSGQRRAVTRTMKAMIKRRSDIEPTIGHMKMDGRLRSNPLKGAIGDAVHAVLCGAGHNIRLLLRKLRLFCASLSLDLHALLAMLRAGNQLQLCIAG